MVAHLGWEPAGSRRDVQAPGGRHCPFERLEDSGVAGKPADQLRGPPGASGPGGVGGAGLLGGWAPPRPTVLGVVVAGGPGGREGQVRRTPACAGGFQDPPCCPSWSLLVRAGVEDAQAGQ